MSQYLISDDDSVLKLSDVDYNGENNFTINTAKTIPSKNCFLNDQLLPKNTIYFSYNNDDDIMLIYERDPEVRTLSFKFSDISEKIKNSIFLSDEDKERFIEQYQKTGRVSIPLQLPYVLFFFKMKKYVGNTIRFTVNEIQVFFRTERMTSINDYLLVPPLPNINQDCRYCSGDVIEIKNYESTIANVVESTVATFYNNSFNYDFSLNMDKYANQYDDIKIFSDYFWWYKLTKNNQTEMIFDKNQYFVFVMSHLNFFNNINMIKSIHSLISKSERNMSYRYQVAETVIDSNLVSVGDCIEIMNTNYEIINYEITSITSTDNKYEIICTSQNKNNSITFLSTDKRFMKIINDNYKNKIQEEYVLDNGDIIMSGSAIVYELDNNELYCRVVSIIKNDNGMIMFKVVPFSSSDSFYKIICIFPREEFKIRLVDMEKYVNEKFNLVVNNTYFTSNRKYGKYLYYATTDTMDDVIVFEEARISVHNIFRDSTYQKNIYCQENLNETSFSNYPIPITNQYLLNNDIKTTNGLFLADNIENKKLTCDQEVRNYHGYDLTVRLGDVVITVDNNYHYIGKVTDINNDYFILDVIIKDTIRQLKFSLDYHIWTSIVKVDNQLKDNRFEIGDYLVSKDDIKNFPDKSVHEVIGFVRMYNKNMMVMSNLNIIDPDWVEANNFIVAKKDIDKMTFDNDNEKKIFLKLRKKKVNIVPKKMINNLILQRQNIYFKDKTDLSPSLGIYNMSKEGKVFFKIRKNTFKETRYYENVISPDYTTMSKDDMLSYFKMTFGIS